MTGHVAEPVLVQSDRLLDVLRVATGGAETVPPHVLRLTTGGRDDSHEAYLRAKRIADRAIVDTLALRAESGLGADVDASRAECRAYLRELIGSQVDSTMAYIVLASRSEQATHTPLLSSAPCSPSAVLAELEHQLDAGAQGRDGTVLMLYLQECIRNADAGLYECSLGPEAVGPFVDDGCCQSRRCSCSRRTRRATATWRPPRTACWRASRWARWRASPSASCATRTPSAWPT